jgi:hypothetical protein
MIIPLHLVPDLHQAAPLFYDLREQAPQYTLGGQSLDPALRPQSAFELGLPIAGPVDANELQRFQQLMTQAGLALQPTRMLYDRLYAFERLAEGHASADPMLRELALRMFQGYQQAGEWIGLMH